MEEATLSARAQLLARTWDFCVPGIPVFSPDPEDVEDILRTLNESDETYLSFWVRGTWLGPHGPFPGEACVVIERFPRRGYSDVWLEDFEPDVLNRGEA